jgi:UDP-N-acetylglucosamine transferase subunit ALG13
MMKNGGADEYGSEWPFLQQVIGEVIASHAGRHPGIIAEAVVERITAAYILTPREQQHREQRKNHQERIRRFSHEVYRILADTQTIEPGREIAARVLKSFLLTRRPPAATPRADGP